VWGASHEFVDATGSLRLTTQRSRLPPASAPAALPLPVAAEMWRSASGGKDAAVLEGICCCSNCARGFFCGRMAYGSPIFKAVQ